MRKAAFIASLFGLLAFHLFASGALNVPLGSQDWPRRFLDACRGPFLAISPLSAASLAAAVIFFTVAVLVIPYSSRRAEAGLLYLSWPGVLNVAFLASGLLLAMIVFFLFSGFAADRNHRTLGVLFAAGVCEAVVGAVLATAVLILRRPHLIFFPALGIFLVGSALLGAMFWLGTGGSA